ncbi:hypothetical protein ORM80_27690, partial [Bacillus cereus]|nr:hypothetical protein [Bacillus cereus]
INIFNLPIINIMEVKVLITEFHTQRLHLRKTEESDSLSILASFMLFYKQGNNNNVVYNFFCYLLRFST